MNDPLPLPRLYSERQSAGSGSHEPERAPPGVDSAKLVTSVAEIVGGGAE